MSADYSRELLRSGIDKLERYGYARNRRVDPVHRDVILTDDEAVAVVAALMGHRE